MEITENMIFFGWLIGYIITVLWLIATEVYRHGKLALEGDNYSMLPVILFLMAFWPMYVFLSSIIFLFTKTGTWIGNYARKKGNTYDSE
jgi:hypothetical protein